MLENSRRAEPLRILYVSQYFPPEMGAPSARVSQLAKIWAQHGCAVTVLTGFPNHPTGVLPAEYRRRIWRLFLTERREGVRVCRTWLYPAANQGVGKRCLNYVSFMLSAIVAGIFLVGKADVVIEPEVKQFIWDAFEKAPELIAAGEAATRAALPQILRALAQPAGPRVAPRRAYR